MYRFYIEIYLINIKLQLCIDYDYNLLWILRSGPCSRLNIDLSFSPVLFRQSFYSSMYMLQDRSVADVNRYLVSPQVQLKRLLSYYSLYDNNTNFNNENKRLLYKGKKSSVLSTYIYIVKVIYNYYLFDTHSLKLSYLQIMSLSEFCHTGR